MAALTEEVKGFIVEALACYDTPTQVSAAVKAEFGLTVKPQQCELYDPTKRAGRNLSEKWKVVFEQTRKRFLENTGEISVANRSVRLRKLERLIQNAEQRGNAALAAQLIEQAAKEAGDAYSNRKRVELTGAGGGPVQNANLTTAEFEDIAKRVASEI